MMRPVLIVGLLVACTTVYAAPRRDRAAPGAEADVERLEVAREHFQRGEQLEKDGQLAAALVEIELAELAHPSATITEAKQRVRIALDAVAGAPAIAALAGHAPAPLAARDRPLHRFIAPIIVAPLAIGTLVVGGALLATVRSDVSHLESSCAPSCAPADVDRLRPREGAAYGLLAAGGVLAVADIVLWGVLAARSERTGAHAAVRPSIDLGPGGGALVVSGAF